jgi:hypothetical protein
MKPFGVLPRPVVDSATANLLNNRNEGMGNFETRPSYGLGETVFGNTPEPIHNRAPAPVRMSALLAEKFETRLTVARRVLDLGIFASGAAVSKPYQILT